MILAVTCPEPVGLSDNFNAELLADFSYLPAREAGKWFRSYPVGTERIAALLECLDFLESGVYLVEYVARRHSRSPSTRTWMPMLLSTAGSPRFHAEFRCANLTRRLSNPDSTNRDN